MVQIRSLSEALDAAKYLTSMHCGNYVDSELEGTLYEFEKCLSKALQQWFRSGTGPDGASGSDWAAGYSAGYAAGQGVHSGNVGPVITGPPQVVWSQQIGGSNQRAHHGGSLVGELGCGAW